MSDEDDPRHPSQPEPYDLQVADADRGDVSFYVERAREADGPLFELAMLQKPHVELLADESPFASASVAGGFDGGSIDADDGVQVWTLEKAEYRSK